MANMFAASTSSSGNSTTAAALAVMLEKEQNSCYRRCPPNPCVPLAEYTQDRPLLVDWCRKLVGQGSFRSPGELVQTVSTRTAQCLLGLLDS